MTLARPLIAAFAFMAALPAIAIADDVAVIVGFHDRADSGIFGRHGGRATTDLSALNACSGRISPAQLRALRAEPGVAYVEEDLVRNKTDYTPDDPQYSSQAAAFGLARFPGAWALSTGAGARVCVLDTGCQTDHPDIAGKVMIVKNFTSSNTSDVTDLDGHGTHTAGTVGAQTGNATGVASAGRDCELAIGKVLGPKGGYDSWIASGLIWAVDTAGAKVVSMSLGGSGNSTTLENGVDYAWSKGAVVVAAAGNSNTNTRFYPAASPKCIAVAATDNSGARASFSNYGSWVDIAAPGVAILSTYAGGAYATLSGTSMACPHVAGAAALVFSKDSSKTNADVRYQLESSVYSTGFPYPDGAAVKMLDANAALGAAALPLSLAAPNVTATAGRRLVTLTWAPVSGAAGYHVRRATTNGGPYMTIATIAGTATSFTNTGLSRGVRYYYVVTAWGEKDWLDTPSSQVSAVPY